MLEQTFYLSGGETDMHGRAPAAGNRLQVTGCREQQWAAPSPSAVPVTSHPSPVTSIGFISLPRFQAEVEAKLLHPTERPIAIHHRGRVISLCQAAEEAGLKVGMRLPQAQAVCPEAEFVPLVEDRYQPFWREVLDICVAHFGCVEPREAGEAFVDLTGLKRPEEALTSLQQAITEQTGLTCQTSCGPSKLVAKMGRRHFPEEQAQHPASMEEGKCLRPIFVEHFLDPLPVTCLWPLDAKTIEHLQALGINTIGLLRRIPLVRLAEHFGKEAQRLHDLARGLDHSPVEPTYPPREVVAHQKLPGGVDNPEAIQACLRELAERVAKELRLRQQACGQVSLHVTSEEGQRASSSLRLHAPSSEGRDILRACRALLTRLNLHAPIAAIHLKASECRRDTGRQLNLFFNDRALARKRERTSQALQVIRECFGNDITVLGAEMELPRRERLLAAISA
jgi:DNA polymerase-4